MKKLAITVYAIATAVAVCLLVGGYIHAGGQIRISPLRTEYELAAGEAKSGTLTVYNDSDDSVSIELSAEAFSVINDQYDYAFDQTSGLARWVSFQQTAIEIPAHDHKSLAYTIGVPIDAEPGGRYISMFVTGRDTADQSSKLSIARRVASLLYITVSGDTTRLGSVLGVSLGAVNIAAVEPTSLTIKNSGTTHFRSRFSIEVSSLFGELLSKQEGDVLILPGTIRRIDEYITMPALPGIYNVIYSIGLGDTPAAQEHRLVVHIPVWSLAVIGVLILSAAVIIKRRKLLVRLRDSGIQD